MKTSFYAKAIALLLVFGFTTSCQNTGGLWLGEGDNKEQVVHLWKQR